MMAVARFLVLSIGVIPCSGFMEGHRLFLTPRLPKPRQPSSIKSTFNLRAELQTRGGAVTSLNAGADYSEAARALFGNVVNSASLLIGGLVPLTFLADPLPSKNKRLQYLYNLFSVLSLANELSAVLYGMVASNKLTEIAVAPASSVFELICRDYELSWIGINVHFMLGLLGFLSLVMLRAYALFPKKANVACAGFAGSFLLGMFSVVNRGVSAGDGAGKRYGSSMLSLVARYVVLVAKELMEKGGVMAVAATVLGIVSTVAAVKAVVSVNGEE